MRLHSALFAIAALIALVPSRIDASPVIFTDRTVFEWYIAQTLPGWVGPNALETFDSSVLDVNTLADVCTRFFNGLTLSSDCHAFGAVEPSAGAALFDQHTFTTTAFFAEPQVAIGFDYSAGSGVVFGLSTLQIFLSGSGFFGLVDTSEPFRNMGTPHVPESIADGVLAMDNLRLRVPEPATWLLLASSFVLLQAARHALKRRRLARCTLGE
jgi:hypothetical protein